MTVVIIDSEQALAINSAGSDRVAPIFHGAGTRSRERA
jgi:hypothetical protein